MAKAIEQRSKAGRLAPEEVLRPGHRLLQPQNSRPSEIPQIVKQLGYAGDAL